MTDSTIITALRQVTDRLEQIDENTIRLTELEQRLENLDTGSSAAPEYESIDLGDDDERQTGMSNHSGIRFEMIETIDGISARLSPRTRAVTTAYLKHPDGEEILEEVSIERLRPGEWVSFETTLAAGQAYEIVADADGREFARGRSTDPSYPIESSDLVVTHGIYSDGGAQSSSYRYCFDRLQPGRDFSNRERHFRLLDDVPRDAEIVDVVYEESIDHEGDLAAEIQSFCERNSPVNHVFVLPSGTYRWSSSLEISSGEFIGLVGEGRPVLNVDRILNMAMSLGRNSGGLGEVLCRGFVVDISGKTADGYEIDAGMMSLHPEDSLVAENLELRGQRARYQDFGDGLERAGNRFTFLAEMVHESAVGAVYNLRLPDGDTETSLEQVGHAIAVSADPAHEGRIQYTDCYIEGFVDNAYYVSNSPGYVELVNCIARNNAGSSIRLGTNDSAKDCDIIFDDMEMRKPASGLWFQGGEPIAEEIQIESDNGNHELVRVSSQCEAGRITGLTIQALPPNKHHTMRLSGQGAAEDLIIEDFEIVDTSSGGTLSNFNSSLNVSRPVTLRNGVIDVSNCPRDAIAGYDVPELENVEILD